MTITQKEHLEQVLLRSIHLLEYWRDQVHTAKTNTQKELWQKILDETVQRVDVNVYLLDWELEKQLRRP